ncbi:hypothetical protein EIP86_005474 [Pleurotus ostreatoroseus]|nr:hypothetical protein EIP86_005474 [Pleurotus ostreatoroseus]
MLLQSGPSSAISDITPAAGWTILDCDPNSMAQDIRVVCTGDAASCNHIYQGGAVGTLVRLPENVSMESLEAFVMKADRCSQVYTNAGSVSMVIQGAAGDVTPDAAASTTRRGFDKRFNHTESTSNPINIDKTFPIFNDSIDCPASGKLPAFSAGVDVNVEAKVNGNVNYGIQLAGHIIPPELNQFDLFADFNATLDGLLNMGATAQATFDTGRIQVFTVGIPGLDIPGIFKLGPSFNIDLEGIATLDAEVNMTVGLAYNVNNGRLVFPPDQGESLGTFTPADNNLQLLASPQVAAQASLEAHVIPNIAFGINVLGKLADANINLDLDTSAKLSMSLQAGANLSKSTNGTSSAADQFDGCVDVSSTLAVNAGADASFLDLFDPSTTVSLFSKTFDLFQKCFSTGSSTAAQNKTPPGHYAGYRRKHPRDIVKRGLTCPSSGATKPPTPIVSKPIPAASIVPESS